MRIALLCTDPDVVFGEGHRCPGRLRGIARALAGAGHEITVVCAAYEDDCVESTPNLEVRSLRMPAGVREIDWHFSRILPDVVIERLVPGSIEGARAAAETGIPHVYDVDNTPQADGLAFSTSVRGALPEALAISRGAITSSRAGVARVRSLTEPAHPVSWVPNAAESTFLHPPTGEAVARVLAEIGLPETGLRIGFFGPLVAGSGLLPLVEAVGSLPKERGARLVVVGDGPERNAALRVADAAGTSLVLCGRVAHRDLSAYLCMCHVVVAPAEADGGAGLSLLQAMAMQRAVLAPATDGVLSVVRDGHDACLVDTGDPAALAQALIALAHDPIRRARLGRNARDTVRERHTWDARAAELEEFLLGMRPIVRSPRTWESRGESRAFSG
jgi:glycosyltransferase involved in cell wall biosynthesis